jgi:hypothetical protein
VVEICRSCYRYHCPSLLLLFQLSVLARAISKDPLQTITIIHSDINVKTLALGNGYESHTKLCTFSAPNDLPNSHLKYCARALNHSVGYISWGMNNKARWWSQFRDITHPLDMNNNNFHCLLLMHWTTLPCCLKYSFQVGSILPPSLRSNLAKT